MNGEIFQSERLEMVVPLGFGMIAQDIRNLYAF